MLLTVGAFKITIKYGKGQETCDYQKIVNWVTGKYAGMQNVYMFQAGGVFYTSIVDTNHHLYVSGEAFSEKSVSFKNLFISVIVLFEKSDNL